MKKDLKEFKEYHKNPREIAGEDFLLLGQALDKYGDLSGIVFNKRTGEVIGGNQRTKFFKHQEASITITETFKEPTRTGTVAIGFVEHNGEKYAYREVDWDDLVAQGANIAANKIGGKWDFDRLANEWEMKTLFENGFKEFEFGFMASSRPKEKDEDIQRVSADSYLAGNIKQIVHYFSPKEFEDVVTRMDAIMQATGAKDHTEVFLKLLEAYEVHTN